MNTTHNHLDIVDGDNDTHCTAYAWGAWNESHEFEDHTSRWRVIPATGDPLDVDSGVGVRGAIVPMVALFLEARLAGSGSGHDGTPVVNVMITRPKGGDVIAELTVDEARRMQAMLGELLEEVR